MREMNESVAKSQLFRLSVGLIELFSAEVWKQSIKNNLQSACCQLQLTANIRLTDNSRQARGGEKELKMTKRRKRKTEMNATKTHIFWPKQQNPLTNFTVCWKFNLTTNGFFVSFFFFFEISLCHLRRILIAFGARPLKVENLLEQRKRKL